MSLGEDKYSLVDGEAIIANKHASSKKNSFGPSPLLLLACTMAVKKIVACRIEEGDKSTTEPARKMRKTIEQQDDDMSLLPPACTCVF